MLPLKLCAERSCKVGYSSAYAHHRNHSPHGVESNGGSPHDTSGPLHVRVRAQEKSSPRPQHNVALCIVVGWCAMVPIATVEAPPETDPRWLPEKLSWLHTWDKLGCPASCQNRWVSLAKAQVDGRGPRVQSGRPSILSRTTTAPSSECFPIVGSCGSTSSHSTASG